MSQNIIKTLDSMNVYDSYKLFKILSSDTYDIAKYFVKDKNHVGGEKGEEANFTYKGTKFLFFKTKHVNSREFHLYPENDEERSNYCIFIIVDLKENFIRLDTIAYNEKCFDEIQKELLGEKNCSGTFLLKMALSFIKQINKNYKMKYITLKDNAFKDCGAVKISVSKMHILIDGNTWYGKHGFLPKKDLIDVIDKNLVLKYQNNLKIINETYVKNVNLEKYLTNVYKNKNNIKYLRGVSLNFMLKVIKEYENKKLSIFMKKLLEYYDDGCHLFYLIYEDIFNELNLYDFHGKPFIKML